MGQNETVERDYLKNIAHKGLNMSIKNPFKAIYDQLNDTKNEIGAFAFPICIDVELTNCCNLKCFMCPTGVGSSIREKGYMSDTTFYKLLNDISGRQVGLRFIRWGEPTLHPKMIDYIITAKNEGHLCHINTNGTTTDRLIDAIIDSKLDSIKFSFQGVNQESYNKIRQGGDFSKIVTNIKNLFNARDNNSPFMQVSTTTTNESDADIAYFIEGLTPYCDMINVGATIFKNIDIDRSIMDEKQKDIFYALKKEQKVLQNRPMHCPEVYGKLSVDWDGKVTACCSDYDRELVVGDLSENTVYEIFMSAKINEYRTFLSQKSFDKIAKCAECFNYMPV